MSERNDNPYTRDYHGPEGDPFVKSALFGIGELKDQAERRVKRKAMDTAKQRLRSDAKRYGKSRFDDKSWLDKLKLIFGTIGNSIAGMFGSDEDPFRGMSGFENDVFHDYLDLQGIDISREDRSKLNLDPNSDNVFQKLREHEDYGSQVDRLIDSTKSNFQDAAELAWKNRNPDQSYSKSKLINAVDDEKYMDDVFDTMASKQFRRRDDYDPSGARFMSRDDSSDLNKPVNNMDQ